MSLRSALLTVAAWALLAVLGNLVVPQLEHVVQRRARAFIPADVPSMVAATESARLFGESPGTTSITLCWNGMSRSRRRTTGSTGRWSPHCETTVRT